MPKFHVSVNVNDASFTKEQLIESLANGLKGRDATLEITGGGQVRRKIDDTVKAEIVAAKQQGMTYAELAEAFQVSTAVINKVLREAGLTNKRDPQTAPAAPKGTRVTISADGQAKVENPQPAGAPSA